MAESSISRNVPSHVPEERLWDADIATFPSRFDDPYAGLSEVLHQGPDIIWATQNAQFGRPGWLVTRYDLVREISMDSERFRVITESGV